MIGLDTNVLIRYLVRDDPEQARKATAFIRSAAQKGESLFLHQVVLCEVVWVLESGYGFSKSDIVEVLEKILLTKQFEFQARDDVYSAFLTFRNSKADFSDLLIGQGNSTDGCHHTVTFDQGLRHTADFKIL